VKWRGKEGSVKKSKWGEKWVLDKKHWGKNTAKQREILDTP